MRATGTGRSHPLHEPGAVWMNFDRMSLSRRDQLKLSAVGLVAGGTTATSGCSNSVKPVAEAGIIGRNGERVLPGGNRSGNQSCQPNERLLPRNEPELLDILKNA